MTGSNLVTYTSREDWLAHRHEGIGASEAPAILGLSPWKSPFALWAEKLGIADDREPSDAMRWGLKLEPVIAAHYAEETGRRVQAQTPYAVDVSADPETPWLRCTLDGTVTYAPDRGVSPGLGVLELKTTNAARVHDWDDGPPLHYVVQVQHQLAVTGYQWGSLAVLIGGQTFRWCDVERNDAFIAELLRKEAEFWRRLVDRDPPDVDGSPASLSALAHLYPKELAGAAPVALPPEADAWDTQRQAAIDTIKTAEALKADAEAHIKLLIGEAPSGVLPGGITYAWKTVERAGYTVAPSSARQLRRSEARRKGAAA